jgi:hypothetical protein
LKFSPSCSSADPKIGNEDYVGYSYFATTSNTNYRKHLAKFHFTEWHAKVIENGWKITKPLADELESRGILQTRRAAVYDDGSSRAKFSEEEFIRHLVKFIVSDDQVKFFV